jgi:hypothetical protein
MKTLIATFLIVLAALFVPATSYAQENCVQVYGGGVVCGEEAPEHEPVDTDLGDINFTVVGGALLLASGTFLYLSRKIKASTSKIK